MTHTISLVVIHKGVEIIVIRVGPPISVVNSRLGRRVDWTVINHMSWGVISSTNLKIAYLISVSPSVTEITLGRQTMMCSMARHWFPTSRTSVQGAGEPVVTEIRAMITLDVGRVRVGVLNENLRGRGGDPLPFDNLDANDFIISY